MSCLFTTNLWYLLFSDTEFSVGFLEIARLYFQKIKVDTSWSSVLKIHPNYDFLNRAGDHIFLLAFAMVSSSVTSSWQIGTNYLCTCFGTWTHEYGMGSWHQHPLHRGLTAWQVQFYLLILYASQQLYSSTTSSLHWVDREDVLTTETFGDTYGDWTLMFRFDFRLNWSWIEFHIFPFLWSDGGVVGDVNAF